MADEGETDGMKLNFEQRKVTVQVEKTIEVARVRVNKYEVENLVRNYIREQFSLGKDVEIKEIEPEIDWRYQEYEGFILEIHKAVA